MSRYRIVLLSVSKRSLTQALYALQSSVELNYKSTQIFEKISSIPLIEVTSPEFKRITRRPD